MQNHRLTVIFLQPPDGDVSITPLVQAIPAFLGTCGHVATPGTVERSTRIHKGKAIFVTTRIQIEVAGASAPDLDSLADLERFLMGRVKRAKLGPVGIEIDLLAQDGTSQ